MDALGLDEAEFKNLIETKKRGCLASFFCFERSLISYSIGVFKCYATLQKYRSLRRWCWQC